mgnify:CR=1 FL=1
MNTQIKSSPQLGFLEEFEFSETRVLAGISPLGEMIAIRPVCENLGIDRKWQQDKIKANPKLSSVGGMVKVLSKDGKKYDMYCLPPVPFQNWLWSLNPKSENFNMSVWEEYKKGLVMYLLMMLKMSLDELQKTAQIKEAFSELSKLTNSIKELDGKISENQEEGKRLKSEKQKLQKLIDEILNSNINQLRIPI